MQEKRSHQRYATSGPVALRLRGDSCNVSGSLVNISEGGALVRCSTPVEIGRDLICVFSLGTQSIKTVGKVCWVIGDELRRQVGPGFGISFRDPCNAILGA